MRTLTLSENSSKNKRGDSSCFDHSLQSQRAALLNHSLFRQVKSISQMRQFMEAHIFAVWDFMSLLKTLQNQLTCTAVPWMPPANAEAARFMNEIVLGEESDQLKEGRILSHFELYQDAMEQCGANPSGIQNFLRELRAGKNVKDSLAAISAPLHVQKFVLSTMSFCALRPHEVAAAFLYGREDIIPEMFQRIIADAAITQQEGLSTLKLYLDRHIEVDGDSHGPMARKLMDCLCGNDSVKWAEALAVAQAALRARQELWDGVSQDLADNPAQ